MSVPVVMVAAMARGRVIGARNGLPWRLSSDLKRYKAITMGKPMVMGRKTHESIGRLLPGRETIIVTRQQDYRVDGAHMAAGLAEALALAHARAAAMGADAVIIAGGAEIYSAALPFADRMILTEVDLDVEGDARFPAFDEDVWPVVSRQAYARGENDDAAYEVVVRERR